MTHHGTYRNTSPALLRQAIRAGRWTGPTSGLAAGYVQTNVVLLPYELADEFATFCHANPRACPLLYQSPPGVYCPREAAPDADLRTDVPRYRIFRQGQLQQGEPLQIIDLWRDDLVVFLLGCSFTFENALQAAGLSVRHIDQGRNVPMYRTSISCISAGRFAGPLVVSMRPYPPEQVDEAVRISSRFPSMHGGPWHVGDPLALGIRNLDQPAFGDPVELNSNDVPLFWACGVTPQLALEAAAPDLCITHSPGHMFVTDWSEEQFAQT